MNKFASLEKLSFLLQFSRCATMNDHQTFSRPRARVREKHFLILPFIVSMITQQLNLRNLSIDFGPEILRFLPNELIEVSR